VLRSVWHFRPSLPPATGKVTSITTDGTLSMVGNYKDLVHLYKNDECVMSRKCGLHNTKVYLKHFTLMLRTGNSSHFLGSESDKYAAQIFGVVSFLFYHFSQWVEIASKMCS
jgi:hypothetical protein